MIKSFKIVGRLLIHPTKTAQEKDFGNQSFFLWFLAQIPMVIILLITGLIDPAPGQEANIRGFLFYLAGSLLICGFSMALGLAKSFLILWAGKKRMGLLEAARELIPLNSLYVLLEAGYTLTLFLLRCVLGQGIYLVIEQICIFGLQLLYSVYAGVILYYREDTSLKRSIVVALGYFWAASAWLLISVFVG